MVVGRRYSDRDLKVGDLVTHALYGKDWIGVIVAFEEDPESEEEGLSKRKALVQIQPGTKHDGFFERSVRSDKKTKNLGLVSIHWLFKWEVKNEDTGFARDETPESE